jgi:predicted GTPase
LAVENDQLMREIQERIAKIRSYTPRVGVLGNSGIGKSSLCNALFGKKAFEIDDVEACTRDPQEVLIGHGSGSGGIILVDVPGIGEDPAHQEKYTALYKSLMPKLDLVLWAIKADDRNYASALTAYSTVFASAGSPPVVFVITQTDKTNPSKDWKDEVYGPGEIQKGNIARKENDVCRRFDISARKIISVAVEIDEEKNPTGRSYNLKELVNLVVEVLPNEKKYSFTREAKEENVSEDARQSAERGIWEAVQEFAGKAWDAIKEKAAEVIVASAPKLISAAVDWFKKTWRSW